MHGSRRQTCFALTSPTVRRMGEFPELGVFPERVDCQKADLGGKRYFATSNEQKRAAVKGKWGARGGGRSEKKETEIAELHKNRTVARRGRRGCGDRRG
ncbi:hypothetical protein BaRGS_00002284 [Batillaria attramentaria]|uniref:Uncharacterized protein n=1 Tax=Batillaria attramentaria TaxID=370345 RepID=A0ABD0M4K5_9CAEN